MGRQQQLTIAIVCGLIVAVLGATTIAAAQSQPQTLTLQMTGQNNSGIAGTATFTQMAGGVHIEIRVNGAGAGPEPAHIHEGSCAQLNPTPQFSLLSVTNGTSTTDVQTTIQTLTASPHAIHMHKSADELSVYVACADISPGALPRTGEADSSTGAIAAAAGLTLLVLGLVLRVALHRRSA
jgi:LPXTG-motif cell wall-anchored protein